MPHMTSPKPHLPVTDQQACSRQRSMSPWRALLLTLLLAWTGVSAALEGDQVFRLPDGFLQEEERAVPADGCGHAVHACAACARQLPQRGPTARPATPANDAFRAWQQAQQGQAGAAVKAPAGDNLAQLLANRQQELRSLAQEHPQLVLELALDEAERQALPAELRDMVEQRRQGPAHLWIFCAMPPDDAPEGSVATLNYRLEWDGIEHIAYPTADWDGMLSGTYQFSDVVLLGNDEAVIGGEPDQIASPLEDAAAPPNRTGPNKVLYMIARFADEAPDFMPITTTTARNRMQVTSEYFRNVSRNRIYFEAIQGNTPGESLMDTVIVTLPEDASTYKTAFATLLNHARSAANAQGFDFRDYNLDVVVTSNRPGFAYAGIAYLGAQGAHLRSDYTSLRTAGHEFGHNFGLLHAYYWRTDSPHPLGKDARPGGYVSDFDLHELIEYGHYFSIMSAQSGGEIDDPTKPYIAPMEKLRMGLYTSSTGSGSDVQLVNTSGTFRIYRHDVREQVTTPRALRIEAPATIYTGSQIYRYWLSYRYAPWNNNAQNFFRNGLLVEIATSGNAYPILLDMTPFTNDATNFINQSSKPSNYWTIDNADKRDGALRVGRTYSDAVAGVHITPVAVNTQTPGDEYLDVVINLGSFPENQPPVISSFTASALEVSTNQTVDFSVVAADPDGDSLAYSWEFDPVSQFTASGQNSPNASRSWGSAGQYKVKVTVSDMRGGIASETLVVTVGTPANSARIAGRVLWGGHPVADARVSIGTTAQAWTNSDGSYELTGLAATSHTVLARAEGLTLTAQFSNPVSLSAGQRVFGKDFHAEEPRPSIQGGATYSVSGSVRDQGVAVPGATVVLAGMSTLSDSNGAWTLNNIPDGTGAATAYKDRMQFTPVSVTVSGANRTGIQINRTYHSITGRVSVNAEGVPITVRAGSASVTGSSVRQGQNRFFDYALQVPPGTYTVVSSADGYLFSLDGWSNPLTVNANLSNRNFSFATTSIVYRQIRGVVTVNGIPVSGATVSASGAASASAVTGADGAYVLGNLIAGTYTLSAALGTGSFTPASRSVTLGGSDITGQNFVLQDSPPTIATAAAASPSSLSTVPASSQLSVLGADDGGEANLAYLWTVTSGPFPVSFSANGTNAAKQTTATFQVPGTYVLQALIADPRGQMVSSSVTVTVASPDAQNLLTISPYKVVLEQGQLQQFSATLWDPQGAIIAANPQWSAQVGSIDGDGNYIASVGGGPFAISASDGGASGQAWVTVTGESVPVVSVSATIPEAGEPGTGIGNGEFTISRTHVIGDLTVSYQLSGTAENGVDYQTLSGSVLIPDGQSSVSIAVVALADGLIEGDETVVLTLTADAGGYVVSSSASATVTIIDADQNYPPVITVHRPANAVAAIPEGVGLILDVEVSDDGKGDGPLTSSWSLVSGPGSVVFESPQSASGAVRFSSLGAYVLRLRADDGLLATERDFAVSVGNHGSLTDPPADDLALRLQLNEEGGSSAADSSGNGRHVTLFNGPQWRPDGGQFRGALDFTANGQYGVVANSENLHGASRMSWSFWLQPSDFNSTVRGILSKRTTRNSGRCWSFFLFDDNRLTIDIGSNRHTLGIGLPAAEWSHLAVVFDGSSPQAERLKVYLNGALVLTASEAQTSIPTASNPVILGMLDTDVGEDRSFRGLIDEVLIYQGRALSAAEVAGLAAPGPGNIGPAISLATLQGPIGIELPLQAQVLDDGLPTDPGLVSVLWQQQQGPAALVIGALNQADTTLQASTEGAYLLRLIADDGAIATFADMEVLIGEVVLRAVSFILRDGFGQLQAVDVQHNPPNGAVERADETGPAVFELLFPFQDHRFHFTPADAPLEPSADG
ncbi:MAG: PKD domain-containing protein [Planctomycetota bacterium]|nr:MAG: PKD domain-containing protein [Planctomycetota bacterium]